MASVRSCVTACACRDTVALFAWLVWNSSANCLQVDKGYLLYPSWYPSSLFFGCALVFAHRIFCFLPLLRKTQETNVLWLPSTPLSQSIGGQRSVPSMPPLRPVMVHLQRHTNSSEAVL